MERKGILRRNGRELFKKVDCSYFYLESREGNFKTKAFLTTLRSLANKP